ncbi:MAG: endonuclease [Sodaliphilus sp.]
MNREHAFPQSWFKEASPMKSDIFHVYPTDGYVNNQRSSYPYGECEGGTRITNGSYYGKGRLGYCTASGYSGKVWEPDDEYKGDFARTYFYMATRYNDKIASWQGNGTAGEVLDGTSYPVYKEWYLNLMLKWHRQDPVSEKELKRNNAVYDLQNNRNPFIDHPELVEYIWGTMQDVAWFEGGSVSPIITSPTNGSTIHIGNAYVGSKVFQAVTVKALNISSDLTVTLSGEGFSTNATTISAADALAGTSITITYTSDRHANATGSLTIGNAEASTTVTLTATASDDMEGLDATNVTATSFTANWTPATDVQSYTLYVAGKGFVAPGTFTLLRDDNIRETTEWTLSGNYYKETGYLRLGTGSGPGAVTSPALDLTSSKGVVTALVTCKAYKNDTEVPLVVETLSKSGTTLDTQSQTITSDDATYAFLLTGENSAEGCIRISNTASNKRVMLQNVKIYAGDARSVIASAPMMAPVESGDSLTREIIGITTNSYTVTGLARQGTFSYQVKAIYNDGTESALTDPVEVVLSGDEHIKGDVNSDGKVDVSDVTALVNTILAITDFPKEVCDINADGNVDVSDVTALVNLILN